MAMASAGVIHSLKYLVTLQQSVVIKISVCVCCRIFVLRSKALPGFKEGRLGLTHAWAGTWRGGINLAQWQKSSMVHLTVVLPKPLA